MAVRVDASELGRYGRELAAAANPVKTRAMVSAAVKKGATNVKTAIEADVAGSSNAAIRRIRVGYDMQTVGLAGIAADISPREGGASELANIVFFGTARGGGGHRFYEHAEAELPALEQYVRKAAEA